MNLVIANLWKRRMRKWCGQNADRGLYYRNFVRRSLTFYANSQVENKREKALAILKPFLEENIHLERIRVRVRTFCSQIEFMQKKIRDQLFCRESKVEVLQNYWDKMYGELMMAAQRKGDAEAKALCKKIIIVPKHIQHRVLS